MAFIRKAGIMLKQTIIGSVKSELATSTPSIYQARRCMSSSKVFVGGIPFSTDEMSLKESFAKYGEVVEARIVTDRDTGRSRGFGFVSYTSSDEASRAIQALDGTNFQGRMLRVNHATERSPTGGFGGGGYGYSGSNYGVSGDYGSGGTSFTSGDRNYAGSGGGYGGGNYGNSGDVNRFGSSSYGSTSCDAGNSGGYGGGSSFEGKDTDGNEDFDKDMLEENNNKDDKDEVEDDANTRV